jgi:Family of unknown function (DUF5990)
VRVAIRGHNLPGRRWEESTYVHVGLQEGREPVGLVPGDAGAASWNLDVRVVVVDDGALDHVSGGRSSCSTASTPTSCGRPSRAVRRWWPRST